MFCLQVPVAQFNTNLGKAEKNTFYLFCIEHSQGPRLMAQSTIEQKKRKSINKNKQRPVKEKMALSVENHVRQFKNIYLSILFLFAIKSCYKTFQNVEKTVYFSSSSLLLSPPSQQEILNAVENLNQCLCSLLFIVYIYQ